MIPKAPTTLDTLPDTLPDWMSEPIDAEDLSLTLASVPRFPKNKAEQELRELTYTHIFEYALDYIAAGTPVSSILRDDPRNISYGRFLRWIKKSPIRNQRYNEAQEIAAEILVDKMDHLLDIGADGAVNGTVEGNKFAFEVMKWKAGSYNKRKFGNNKSVELTTTDIDDNKLKTLSTSDLKKMVLEQNSIDGSVLDNKAAEDTDE